MRWQDYISQALDYQSTHTIEDVEAMIEEGYAKLWLGENSAAVTEIIRFPQMKTLHLWLCGGDMDEIIYQMLPQAEEYAKAEGCSRLTTGGRKGWDKVMKRVGYSPIASVCAKDLS